MRVIEKIGLGISSSIFMIVGFVSLYITYTETIFFYHLYFVGLIQSLLCMASMVLGLYGLIYLKINWEGGKK